MIDEINRRGIAAEVEKLRVEVSQLTIENRGLNTSNKLLNKYYLELATRKLQLIKTFFKLLVKGKNHG